MSYSGFVVLFAVIWFITLWVVLPIGLRTQGEEGDIVEGTHSSAPAAFNFWRTVRITTIWALVIWTPIIIAIVWSGVTLQTLDPWALFN